jgi:hypothetical protein
MRCEMMQGISKLFNKLIASAFARSSNLLYRRLEDALQRSSRVWIETNNDSFAGIPIYLDSEFVEILALSTPDDEEPEDSSYKRTTWLIRLPSIDAIAYPTEHWSKDRFEHLLSEDAFSSETDS